jgi:hypothetical protein
MIKLVNTSRLRKSSASLGNSKNNVRGDGDRAGVPDLPIMTSGVSDDDLLAPAEMAIDLNCSKSYLDKLRCYGGGPPYIRLGPRKILYRRGDGRGWAKARRFNSTAEYKKE